MTILRADPRHPPLRSNLWARFPMRVTTMTTPNKVVHFEIPAEDPKRAKLFYERSFSWKINEVPGMSYWMVGTTPVDDKQSPTEIGGINGGLSKKSDVLKHPVFTIDVPDIERALLHIEKNGGKTVQKKQAIPNMGYTAYFKDPEGNVVGLWQNLQ